MISIPPPAFPAISADASHRVSSSPRKLIWLTAQCALLAVLLCGAGSTVSAQTAHFSGSTPPTWVQSVLQIPTQSPTMNAVAVDGIGNIYAPSGYFSPFVTKNTPSVTGYTTSPIGTGIGSGNAVAVDGSGNVYIADGANLRLVKETLSGGSYVQSTVTSLPSNAPTYLWPFTVDGSGNIYIGDTVNYQIIKETLSAGIYTQSTVVSGLQNGISAIAVDQSGNLYYTDQNDHAAVKLTLVAGGYQQSMIGSTDMGVLLNGVAVDRNGNVFMSGAGGGGGMTVGLAYAETLINGSYVQSILNLGVTTIPYGLSVDAAGNVYIAGNGGVLEESPVYGSFGSINIGSASAQPISMNFTFDTAGTLGSTAVLTQGATGLDFADAGTGTCAANTSYAAGQTCTINVKFTPRSAGTRYGAAVLYDGVGSVLATGYVQGTGIGPQINFLPISVPTGNEGKLGGGFSNPNGVAVDGGGNVYVADYGNNAVKKIPPGCTSASCVTTLGGGFNGPVYPAVDGSGNVYVTDNSAVKEIPPGCATASCVATLGGGFNIPAGVAVDGSGNVYVTDHINNAVKEIPQGCMNANCVTTLGGGFLYPEGVAVDGIGNVYVLDSSNSPVKEIPLGCVSASCVTTLDGFFNSPAGVAVDGSGNVYIADFFGAAVQEKSANCSSASCVTTLFGGLYPEGVAVDGSGNVYVTGNNAVMEIDRVTSPSLTFPSTQVNATSAAQTVTITNDGNAPLSFTKITYPAIFPESTSATNDCKTTTPLASNETCTLTIDFTPQVVGALSGSLVLTDNNLNAAAPAYATQSIALSGTGTSSFTLGISPASLTIIQGSSGTSNITVTGQNGFTGSVSFAASGLPSDVTASFSPDPTTGTTVVTLTAISIATIRTYSVTITGTSGTLSATTTLTLTVNPGPSFTISAPATVNLNQGASSTSAITVIPQNGFTGSVHLALYGVYGLPAGVTASFSPNPTAGTSALTLTASASTVAGTYSLLIEGTDGDLNAQIYFNLVINTAPAFNIGVSPAFLSIVQGGSGTSGITVTDFDGFTGSVQLAAANLPNGVTASFIPNPTTGTSTLMLTASNSAVLGFAPVTIVGTSGALTEEASLALTVNPVVVAGPPPGVFGAVNIGTTSPAIPLTFTIVNGGTLGSTAVLTQGASGLDFADAGSGTCAPNSTYAAGQTCTVNVTFTPKFAGTRYGAVVLKDNNGNVIATAYFQGLGVGPQINFLPGTESTVVTTSGAAPTAIAVDGNGNIYIANGGRNWNAIWKETPSAGGYTESTIPTSSLSNPSGIAVDGSGNVYITDDNRVLKETPSAGTYSESVVADLANNGILGPASLAVDVSGNVYFLGSDSVTYQEYLYEETPSAGSYTQSTIPYFGVSWTGAIAVDGNGSVYIVDTGNGQVIEETPSAGGYVQSTVPTNGLIQPYGIAVDGMGNIYVADISGGPVFKETLTAGSYIQSTISTSQLFEPLALAVDGSGNVYIGDANNQRVLKEDFADTPSLSFASTVVGSTSTDSPQTVTVENVGNVALSFPVPLTGSNPSTAANFTLNSGASACPLVSVGSSTAGALAAGASCLLPISFTPAAAGALSGSLVLADNNLNAAAPGFATQSITLSGTGTQATPTITWSTPTAITYGTPLSAIQLNATASVAGSFTYSPAAGTMFSAGPQTLTATFTPTDATDYTTATATVTLTVNQATPTITWATPAAITYGAALSGAQLNASSPVAGTFIYSPSAGTVLNAGTQTLTATFTPTDTTDYAIATATVTLRVNKAPLTVHWTTPAAIFYGTALSGTQLDATSTATGTYVYSPAAGTVLAVGSHTLNVTFTPANAANYTSSTAKAIVTLTVNKARPAITWATPAAITYGTALSATQLDANSTVAGSFTYSPVTGKVLTAGQQTLTVTFTPTNSTDYTTATATVTLTVNKATPTITWATPAAITYGTALSATQLSAKASVPGALVYSPVAGTVPAVGTDTLTVTFTPTDTTDYATATDSVLLKVNPAPSFTLGASPASLTIAQGASGKSTITVTNQNGFTGKVTLAASGLPSGVTAAFATNPTTGTSVLTLTASSTATVGSATINIKGTSGSLTASTNIALTINCTPTTITPYISVNGGSTWTQESSATVSSPSAVVDLGPQPASGGTWSWTGPNRYTSTSRQINNIPLTVGADSYLATYTNASGCKSTETFTINVK